MVTDNSTHWRSIEQWSPTLFLVGGALTAAHAAMLGVQAFTEVATPPDVFAPTASLLVFAGLAGLYRPLAQQVQTSARVGAACVVLGMAGFAVIAAGNFAELVGLHPPGWVAVFTVPAIVGTISGFAAFGIASLRADRHSRPLGLLLLAPAALFVGLIANVVILETPALGGIVISSGLALVYVAIGYSLRTGVSTTESETPAGDVAMG